MILRRGETVVLQGAASLGAGEYAQSGVLTISTQRLVFEVGGVSPFTAIDVHLDQVWNVHVGGDPGGMFRPRREFLTVESSDGRWLFTVAGASQWASTLVHAKSLTPPPPPPPAPPPPPTTGSGAPVIINMPATPAPKIMLHCRYCGALYDSAGGRCDKCGARPQ